MGDPAPAWHMDGRSSMRSAGSLGSESRDREACNRSRAALLYRSTAIFSALASRFASSRRQAERLRSAWLRSVGSAATAQGTRYVCSCSLAFSSPRGEPLNTPGRSKQLARTTGERGRTRAWRRTAAGQLGKVAVWRKASPSASAAEVARFIERTCGRIGMRSRASQASAMAGGTPALSFPNSRTSSAMKPKS